MKRVIVTGIYTPLKYTYISKYIPMEMSMFFEEVAKKFNWFLKFTQHGGTIQGVLDSEDIKDGFNFCNEIINKYEEFLFVISVDDVEQREPVEINYSKGMIKNGRYIDRLLKEGKTGIFVL